MSKNFVKIAKFWRNVILVTVTIVLLGVLRGVSSVNDILYNPDDEDTYANREVNDACLTKNRTSGICKLDSDCAEVLAMILKRQRDFVSCGFQGARQIVCCPMDNTITTTTTTTTTRPTTTTMRSEVDTMDYDCNNTETGEKGFIKFSRFCPELNGKLSELIDPALCSYHNYALCYDVVCCPIRTSTRLKQKCRFYDDPDNEIKLRVNLNLECGTSPPENGIKSFYSTECQLTDLPKVAITKTSQVQPQCCPSSSITKFLPWDSPDFRFIKVMGRNCTSTNNSKGHGTCRPYNQCPVARIIDADACYIHRETQFVCCEDEMPTGTKRFEHACYNYSQEVYSEVYQLVVEPIDFANRIGRDEDRPLIQGIISKPTEYPHMVALGYNTSANKIEFSCSGSIISEKFVLTVAQCLYIYDLSTGLQVPVLKVRVGVTSLKMSLTSNDCPEDYDVDELTPHPDFSRERYYNDIGLIKLIQSLQFNAYVRPICLPSTNIIPPEVIALGYGAVSDINPTNDKLVKILLDTYTADECKMYFERPFKKLSRGIDARNQVCAGSRSLLLNACPADSGGSLVQPHSDFYETSTLIGLTIYSKMCGFLNNPGIYTRVYAYRDWIENIVWKTSQ